MKRVWVALSFFILSSATLSLRIEKEVRAEQISVSYRIINDVQIIEDTLINSGSFLPLPQLGSQIIQRENVTLSSWFKNESLTIPFSFVEESIEQPLTLYAEWQYMNDSIQKASLTLSKSGTSFTTGSVTISFPLYAPLTQGVTYQWQSRLAGAPMWRDIDSANEMTYTPNRNGTYDFRVKYFVQQFILGTWQTVRKESESLTLTFTSTFDWQLVYYPLGLLTLIGVVFWVNRRQPIDYYIGGKRVDRRFMKVYEDISLQPHIEKIGYTFHGWYLDQAETIPFEGMRMPRKKVILYGSYRKKS